MSEKVSVIICTYNYARFLPQCLESVFSQTRPPDEVIVVDDGSTDATPEVVRRFEGVHYIRQEHAGKAAAFNRGFEAATGDLICHFDSDDYWFPTKIERLIEMFKKYPEAGGLMHDAVMVWEDEAPSPDFLDRDASPDSAALMKLDDILLSMFYYLPRWYRRVRSDLDESSIIAHPGAISVRRDAIHEYFPLPKELGLSVDGFLLLASAQRGCIYLSQPLSVYRHHEGSYWRGNPIARENQFALYRWLLANPIFTRALSPGEKSLLLAKIAEDAMVYELSGGPRKDHSARFLLPLRLLASGILPGWKHWALGLAFPLVKLWGTWRR